MEPIILRQGDPARGPREQPRPEVAFEAPEHAADGALDDLELRSGLDGAVLPGCGLEGGQPSAAGSDLRGEDIGRGRRRRGGQVGTRRQPRPTAA